MKCENWDKVLCKYTKLGFVEKSTYEAIKKYCYCVHIEIENAVRCTRKEQWSRNEFCWLRCFFLSYARKKRSEKVLTDDDLSEEVLILLSGKYPRRFHRNL